MIREHRLKMACAAGLLSCAVAAQAQAIAVYGSFRPFAGVSELVGLDYPAEVVVLTADRSKVQFWNSWDPGVTQYGGDEYRFFGIGRTSQRFYYGYGSEGRWNVASEGVRGHDSFQSVLVGSSAALAAIDDDRFVLLSAGNAAQLSVWSTAASAQVGTGPAVAGRGRLVADGAAGLVFFDHEDAAKVEVFRLEGNALVQVADLPLAQAEEHELVLSNDGRFLYYGVEQFDLRDLAAPVRSFSEPILAATWEVAYGSRSYFDARTGARLGELPGTFSVYGSAPGARDVWAYDAVANRVRHMAAVPEPATWALFAAGAIAAAGVRRARQQRA